MKCTNSLKDNLPKLHKKIDNLNRAISIKETKSIITNVSKQKTPSSDSFTGKFYQTLMKELISILYNFFQGIEAEGIILNLS